MPDLQDRFVGCLLGLAVGDAPGARFEAQSPDWIAQRYPTAASLITRPPVDELWYTDDTQMAIGVAETLVVNHRIIYDELCRTFVANYMPSRGYGRGARRVLEAMEDGEDHRLVAEKHLPGGSYGNGAAMRVAPVGLLFGDNPLQLLAEARESALPTHTHRLGIEGARLLALAVGIVSRANCFDRDSFFEQLFTACESPEYREKLAAASVAHDASEMAALGNGIEALHSVPTAIACFALHATSYDETIGNAVLLGGDTDTIAAMAGALSGALHGAGAIPPHLLAMLENQAKGRDYIRQLASDLHTAYRGSVGAG